MEYRTYQVYILTNKNHTVLYIGVTSNLKLRVEQHKMKIHPKSFTARYNVNELVYYEQYFDIGEAIAREKQIKAGSRQKKLDLVFTFNLDWRDLYEDLWKFGADCRSRLGSFAKTTLCCRYEAEEQSHGKILAFLL